MTDYRALSLAGPAAGHEALGQLTQNGYAERFMCTLKDEEVYLHEYLDFTDAYRHIAHFLDDVYMHKQVHSAMGYLPPVEFEAAWRATAATSGEPLCASSQVSTL